MQTYETPYISDWFAISLRWAVMLGCVVSLALGGGLTILPLFWPIGALVVWNMGMTVLASLNTRIRYHRHISLAVDLLLSGTLFWAQGGLAGPVAWVGLLPVLTGAIYFEFWGALISAVIHALLSMANAYLYVQGFPLLALGWAVAYLALGGLFGFLGRQLATRLRAVRQKWLETENKKYSIQSERLRAIYELTSTLTATLSYKRVLDSALDLGFAALNPDPDQATDDPLVSAVLLFKGGHLRVGSARRFTQADMRVTFPAAEGILQKVFEEGEPIFSKDIGYDAELGHVIAFRNCTSAYCFPLRSGFNVYGAMIFAHPDAAYFTPDRRDMLDLIGRQSVVAIQNARLYQDLVEEKERMIDVHEEARKKLARDLHDGPTQSVAAMAMRINIARRLVEKDPKSAVDELSKIEELAHRTTKEIRHMLFTLRPLILESQGLGAALKSMADKMRETYNQNVTISIDEKIASQMEMGKQGVIFYIIEEAINNARKHASASNIWVRLAPFQPGVTLLEIEDNGVGFDVEAVNKAYDKRSSLGMVNLRERTELVNGLLNIQSTIGKGTKVQVYIPLTEEAADRLHHGRSH
ncbi:MAG TPA: GAF domain-containing sensor histidine kinase [Anaerolineales bacterium]|nr:GAF domain-containing sensor histidine kinase [Anaerolineales bacterium]